MTEQPNRPVRAAAGQQASVGGERYPTDRTGVALQGTPKGRLRDVLRTFGPMPQQQRCRSGIYRVVRRLVNRASGRTIECMLHHKPGMRGELKQGVTLLSYKSREGLQLVQSGGTLSNPTGLLFDSLLAPRLYRFGDVKGL